MKSFVFFVALLVAVVAAQTNETLSSTVFNNQTSSPVTLNDVLKAIGAPRCARRCVEPLAEEAGSLFSLNNIVQNYRNVCDAYTKTSMCNAKAQSRGCWAKPALRHIYEMVTSGVKDTCETHRDQWDVIAPCLEQNNSMDNVLNECGAKCSLLSNFTLFTSFKPVNQATLGKQLLDTLDDLNPVCEALLCFFPCARDGLNAVCPTAGNLTMSTLLKPFEEASKMLSTTAPVFQEIIEAKLSDKCQSFLDLKTLQQLYSGSN